MLSKEKFIEYLTAITKYNEEADKLSDFFEANLFESPLFTKATNLTNIVISYLSDVNEYVEDLINWWLYEDVDKVLHYKDKEISVKTIDELYNYINENYYDNKGN